MPNKFASAAILVSACVWTVGCTTLSVHKVAADDTKTPGIRYSLPRLFLKATPGGDGTITVEELYLPDTDNTFAISGESYLAAHTLNVQVERGLLKRVDWKPDSSAVVQESAAQGAALAADRAKAEAESAKADLGAIADAREALAGAELTVTKAKIKWDGLRADPNAAADKVRDAQIEYQQAVAAREAAREALDRLLGSGGRTSAAGAVGGSGNVAQPGGGGSAAPTPAGPSGGPPADGANGPAGPTIPHPPVAGSTPATTGPGAGTAGSSGGGEPKVVNGPVLYVLEDSGTPTSPRLKLRAVGTYHKPPGGTLEVIDGTRPWQPGYKAVLGRQPAPPAPVSFFPQGLSVVTADSQNRKRLIVSPSAPLAQLKQFSLTPVDPAKDFQPTGDTRVLKTVSLDSGVQITVDLSREPVGTYRLEIHALRDTPGKDKADGWLYVEVR